METIFNAEGAQGWDLVAINEERVELRSRLAAAFGSPPRP
jgi:hypothetical protein